MEIQKFNLDDNTYLRFTKQGKGEPLLLLHTLRNRIEYSDNLLPYLSEHFTVYIIDLPGHGDSPINKEVNYTHEYLTESVAKFIESENLNKLTIAGESIGGVLSASIAKQIPERIKKIFCFNSYDYDKRFAQGVRRGNFMAEFLLFHVSLPLGLGIFFAKLESFPTLWMIFRGGVYKKSAITKNYIKLLCKSIKKPGFVYHERNMFKNYASLPNYNELYSDLKIPVSLIYGDHDWSKNHEREATMDALNLKKYSTMEKTGHFSFLESPELVAKFILEG